MKTRKVRRRNTHRKTQRGGAKNNQRNQNQPGPGFLIRRNLGLERGEALQQPVIVRRPDNRFNLRIQEPNQQNALQPAARDQRSASEERSERDKHSSKNCGSTFGTFADRLNGLLDNDNPNYRDALQLLDNCIAARLQSNRYFRIEGKADRAHQLAVNMISKTRDILNYLYGERRRVNITYSDSVFSSQRYYKLKFVSRQNGEPIEIVVYGDKYIDNSAYYNEKAGEHKIKDLRGGKKKTLKRRNTFKKSNKTLKH